MCLEANHDLTHSDLKDYLATYLRDAGFTVHVEQELPDGRIADLLAVSRMGELEIIDCKTESRDSTISYAWEKYSRWSNYVWIAYPRGLYKPPTPAPWPTLWRQPHDNAGIVSVDRLSFKVERPAIKRYMSLSQHGSVLTRLNWS